MNVFVADVVTRLETTPKSRTVLAAEFRPPAHLSMGDYIEKIESEGQGFADQLVSLPIAQKTFAKHSLVRLFLEWRPQMTTSTLRLVDSQ